MEGWGGGEKATLWVMLGNRTRVLCGEFGALGREGTLELGDNEQTCSWYFFMCVLIEALVLKHFSHTSQKYGGCTIEICVLLSCVLSM